MESWFPVHPSYTRTPFPALGNAAAGTTVTFEASQKCCIANATDGTDDDILWQDVDNAGVDPDDHLADAAAAAPGSLEPLGVAAATATTADHEKPGSPFRRMAFSLPVGKSYF